MMNVAMEVSYRGVMTQACLCVCVCVRVWMCARVQPMSDLDDRACWL